jgi:hypothetical protein
MVAQLRGPHNEYLHTGNQKVFPQTKLQSTFDAISLAE